MKEKDIEILAKAKGYMDSLGLRHHLSLDLDVKLSSEDLDKFATAIRDNEREELLKRFPDSFDKMKELDNTIREDERKKVFQYLYKDKVQFLQDAIDQYLKDTNNIPMEMDREKFLQEWKFGTTHHTDPARMSLDLDRLIRSEIKKENEKLLQIIPPFNETEEIAKSFYQGFPEGLGFKVMGFCNGFYQLAKVLELVLKNREK